MSIINIKSKEKKPAALLLVMFFAIVSMSITGSSVRDTAFLLEYDRTLLPIMYVMIALVMAAIIPIYKKLVKGKDHISVIKMSGIWFAITIMLIKPNMIGLLIPVFYVWMEIITIISILQFWVLAGEIFNARQAKRLFPIITAGGSFSGMGIGYIIKPIAKNHGYENLLILTLFFILITIAIAHILVSYVRKEKFSHSNDNSGNKSAKVDTYIKFIAGMVGISAFISKVVDYQFKIMAVNTYPEQDALVSFFGTYYMLTGLATLIMQFFVSGTILGRLGILVASLVLPISLAFGSIGFFLLGTITTVFTAKFSDQVFKFSINNSVQEILWLPVARQMKRQSKPIIDGTIRSGMEGLAGVLIFLLISTSIISESQIYSLSLVIIFAIFLWIWNNMKLKEGYVKTLMSSIENRQLNFDNVRFDINDTDIIKTLDNALKDDDELKQLFALDLLRKLPLTPWKRTLETLFIEGKKSVKDEVIKLTWNKKDIITNDLIIQQINADSKVSPTLISCAADRNINGIKNILVNYLKSSNIDLKLSAAISLFKIDSSTSLAKSIIHSVFESGNKENITKMLGFMRGSNVHLSDTRILMLFKFSSNDIKNATLKLVKEKNGIDLINPIIDLLMNPKTFENATIALNQLDLNVVSSKIREKIKDPKCKTDLKVGILKSTHQLNDKKNIDLYLLMLKDPELIVLDAASNALLKKSKTIALKTFELKKIHNIVSEIAERAYQLFLFKENLNDKQGTKLLVDHIESDLNILIPIILKLGTLENPEIPIETYIRFLQSKDPYFMPMVLELVETTFSKNMKKITLPLIDQELDKIKFGKEFFPEMFKTKDEMLLFWSGSKNYWKTGIAIHFLIKENKINILDKINWKNIPKSIFASNLFNFDEQQYLKQYTTKSKLLEKENSNMYSILEKTLILKSVDMFNLIPGDILNKVAQISKELEYQKGSKIFKQGDNGDSMFVIISGGIEISQNRKTITTLKSGQCIGEMALLDQEPRSADAITIEDTILLEIDQESFYELMSTNQAIMKQIIKILTKRLRETNQKLTTSL